MEKFPHFITDDNLTDIGLSTDAQFNKDNMSIKSKSHNPLMDALLAEPLPQAIDDECTRIDYIELEHDTIIEWLLQDDVASSQKRAKVQAMHILGDYNRELIVRLYRAILATMRG